jgi:HD-GYP domain-containing protein (c-di-GMP phosphodiesterase class II)
MHDAGLPAQPTLDAVAYLGHYLLAGVKRRIADRDGYEHANFVRILGGLMAARSPSLAGHADRVLHYAENLALAVGVDAAELRITRRAALLHDLGKIGVADALLDEPHRLNEKQRALVEQHPVIGERLLGQLPGSLMQSVAAAVGAHHERIDGTGYPRGLRDHQIPKPARIISICEAYDAMTSAGMHKPALSREDAIMQLRTNAGKQFDAKFVEIFQLRECFTLDPGLRTPHRDEL